MGVGPGLDGAHPWTEWVRCLDCMSATRGLGWWGVWTKRVRPADRISVTPGPDGCGGWTGWVRAPDWIGCASGLDRCGAWTRWVTSLDQIGVTPGLGWVSRRQFDPVNASGAGLGTLRSAGLTIQDNSGPVQDFVSLRPYHRVRR